MWHPILITPLNGTTEDEIAGGSGRVGVVVVWPASVERKLTALTKSDKRAVDPPF